jgi:hypothetical protein
MRHLALCVLCLAQPLAAETRQHGNIIFELPEGFSYDDRGPTGTLAIEARSDLADCQGCRILIGAGAVASGPVEAFLATNTRRLIAPELADPPRPSPLQPAEGFDLQGRYPAALQRQWLDTTLQMLFAAQINERMELIAFEIPYQDEAQMQRAFGVYDREFVPFLEGLRFVSDGAEPLMPAAEPGPLSAVWWRVREWTTSTWNHYLGYAVVRDHVRADPLTFWPDGYFYDGPPTAGTGPIEPARLLAAGDMSFGTYRVAGDLVTLAYASGAVTELRLAGTQLQTSGGTSYDLAELYADGTTIEGRIARIVHVAPGAVAGETGGVITLTDVAFRPDGTWSGTEGEGLTVSGRYEVRNGVVLIRHPSGGGFGAGYMVYAPDGTIWIGSEKLL